MHAAPGRLTISLTTEAGRDRHLMKTCGTAMLLADCSSTRKWWLFDSEKQSRAAPSARRERYVAVAPRRPAGNSPRDFAL